MKWKEKIQEWSNGIVQSYPADINQRFFYETSACDKTGDNQYEEVFVESSALDALKENLKPFISHIKASKSASVTVFDNLSGGTRLIIPMPRKRHNYTTMKDFIDEASGSQQINFWKKVAVEIKAMLKLHDKIWVNTHGLGVSYFHLRLDTIPKYYQTKKLK